MKSEITFDSAAVDYQNQLQKGLDVSGESAEYFAQARIAWTAKKLEDFRLNLGSSPKIMDYGCGVGLASPLLINQFSNARIFGLDSSIESLKKAQEDDLNRGVSFLTPDQCAQDQSFDLIYCNGVIHHTDPQIRRDLFASFYNYLRPGGVLALWENNPWNPGTRIVMKRIPFDKDAIVISSLETRSIARSAKFEILETNFLFIFPNFLRMFRPLEKLLCRAPLGAQYLVLCKKPG